MFHSDIFWYISKYQVLGILFKIHLFTEIIYEFEKHVGSFLSRSTVGPQGWGFRCVVHFANKHACLKFCDRWLMAWQPIPTRLFEKCDIGASEYASVHGIGIVVLIKLMKYATKSQSLLASTPCSHKSHISALVTVHDFNFQLNLTSSMNCDALSTMKMAARATVPHARDSKHQSNHRRTKPAAGSGIVMWR